MSRGPRKVDEGQLRLAACELAAAFVAAGFLGLLVGERFVSLLSLGAAVGVAAEEALRRLVVWYSPEVRPEELP